MQIDILPDAARAATKAASLIATQIRETLASQSRINIALSGGKSPGAMLAALSAREDVSWQNVHFFQVDERVAPDGSPDRNLTLIQGALHPVPRENIHAMPVTAASFDEAMRAYDGILRQFAGAPPIFDLVQLGIGEDGHTASLVPSDSVLRIMDRDLAITQPYQGLRRMTLTFPVLNRARRVLWLVTGEGKAAILPRLMLGDSTIPAGRVAQNNAIVVADQSAASKLENA